MPDTTTALPADQKHRIRRRWIILGSIALFLAILASATVVIISHAAPIVRARITETLSTRFRSRVELDDFTVSVWRGLEISGKGLRVFGNAQPTGSQPLIGVAAFRFRTNLIDLFRSPMHVNAVYLSGLRLNVPPKQSRQPLRDMGHGAGKIKIVVDHFVCDDAELVINTAAPGKLPLEFDITSLSMTSAGQNEPFHFDAKLINPKPVGDIASSGLFGPWQADSPGDTPVSGTYSFDHADLSTIRGIAGTLSSTGEYEGSLDNISVDGTTETPDFQIATAGRPVPLHTAFHAIVDGTSGDTYLQPVRAKILSSWIVAEGSVVRVSNPNGHRISLNVKVDRGEIEDLLKLAVKNDPPIMTGKLTLKTKFDLSPGKLDVPHSLRLAGQFEVAQARFTNDRVQGEINGLSARSLGKAKLAKETAPDVDSDLRGTFRLADGVLDFPNLGFEVPGTRVMLTGNYSLNGQQFDFHGKTRFDAKLSHMVTGWKALMLKPVDPFFSKNGAGTELPIKVTGTGSTPHISSDFGHKDQKPAADNKSSD